MNCFRIRFLSVFLLRRVICVELVILCFVYFLFVIVWFFSTSAIDCLERLVSQRTLNLHTHCSLIFAAQKPLLTVESSLWNLLFNH